MNKILFGAAGVFAAASLQAAVYLKADAPEGGDGTSWSKAYRTLQEALADLKTKPVTQADRTLYVAQGCYKVTGSSVTAADVETRTIDCVYLYGGYKADSDADLPGERDVNEYQTIFGPKIDGVWKHCVPNLGAFTYTTTTLAEPVVKAGKINFQPFTGDYDWYDATVGGDNVATPVLRIKGSGGTVDGVSFVGAARVSQTGNSGMANCLQVEAGYAAMVVSNCNFVANHPTSGCINLAAPAAGGEGLIAKCRVFGNGYMYSSGTSAVRLSAGVTMTDCVISGNSKGNGYAHTGVISTSGLVKNCVITHNSYVQMGTGNGISSVLGGGSGTWENCVITNNYSAYDSGKASLLHLTSGTLRNTLVANNLFVCKPVDAGTYFMLGSCDSTTSQSLSAAYEHCLFASNRLVAASVAAASGSYALGLLGGYHNKSGYTLKNRIVGCQFEGNRVEVPEVSGVMPSLSRGVLLCDNTGNATSARAQAAVSNCTFRAAHQDGVFDIVQYGLCKTHKLPIANCVFTEDDADVHVDTIKADDPGCLSVAYCTVKNLLPTFYPAEFDITPGLQYDDIPFAREAFCLNGVATGYAWLKPAACTPGIRETTDGTVRGAVDELTETAETGVTLTVRRVPFAGGTVDVPVQAVATGTAIRPVTAVPVQGGSFAGWLREDGSTFSTANPLTISEQTEDLVLTANFATRQTRITFDLNGAGTFDESGETSVSLDLAAGAEFPEIPAYTVAEGLHIYVWDEMPSTVPGTDATYCAHWVTKDLRTLYVAPGGTGSGTSWADASGDLAAAYANAGRYRGEVLLKGGTYEIAVPISVVSNVCVRGGFDGEAVLSGGGVAYHAFLAGEGVYPNSAFSNLTFRAFARSAIRFAGSAADVTVSDCRFEGCNLSKDSSYAALDIQGQLTLENSAFTNNCRALRLVNISAATNTIVGCDFFASTGGCASVTLVRGSRIAVRDCAFRQNRAANNATDSNASLGITCSTEVVIGVTISDCLFESNTALDSSSMLATYGGYAGSVLIERCAFVNNGYESTNSNSKGDYGMFAFASTALCVAGKSSTTLVRDCRFTGNGGVCKGAAPSYGVASAVLSTAAGYVTLLNCTMENNDINSTVSAAAGTILKISPNGKLGIVNCTFDGNAVAAAQSRHAEIVDYSKSPTRFLYLANSILHNAAANYRPLDTDVGSVVGLGSCFISNYSREDLAATSVTEWTQILTEDPLLKPISSVGPNGVVARELEGQTPARNCGYDVWCDEAARRVVIRIPEESADRRWLDVGSGQYRTDATVVNWGISPDVPLVPDGWGQARRRGRVSAGAVNAPKPGMLVIFR